MNSSDWRKCIKSFDARRNLALPGNLENTLNFCVEYFIDEVNKALLEKDFFTIALSGGSTPKAILNKLTEPQNASRVQWDRILFFFGDERNVPATHPDSNYKMAMDAALSHLKIPHNHIFRMQAENNLEEHAEQYEALITKHVPNAQFDLVTLGMGDDGHTASLFPHTDALKIHNRWVVANHIPQKHTERMTLTYSCINQAFNICFFVMGKGKASMVSQVLQGKYQPLEYPSQKIGTEQHPALWILDDEAASELK